MNHPRLPRLAALALAAFAAVGSLCLWMMSLTTAPVAQAAGESVQFSAATYSAAENGGGVVVTLTVTPAAVDPLTFTVTSADGSATSASDFSAVNSTVSLPVSTTEYTFTVPITDDGVYEGNETFTLSLSAIQSGVPGTITATTLTIIDNETQPTVQLSSGTYIVAEGAGNATLSAQLSWASAFPVSVNVAATDGSAGASDYTGVTTTLNFAPGTTLTSTTVAINPDTLDEEDETFIATLSAPVSATLTAPTTATVTITDDDNPPFINLSAGTQTVAESVGTVNVGVTLSTASGRNVTVPFTVSGTAGGGDHSLTNGNFTINAGLTSGSTTFNVISDTVDEENETVIVTLGTPINASPTAPTVQTITINDDDDPPSLSVADIGVLEGNAGNTTATFTLNLSAASERTLSVDVATANGSALAGSDYTGISGTVTFSPGQTSRPFAVNVIGDAVDEPDETFVINLTNPINVSTPDVQATAVITDDDAAPGLSVNDVSVGEGDSGTTNATFTVTLSDQSQSTITVTYTTADGTATIVDYAGVGGTLTFTPGGALTQTVTVDVLGDTLNEVNETFTLALTGATNANITDNTGLGTITDDDNPPAMSVNDVTVTEGTGGTTNAIFTVSLSPQSGRTVSVNYAATSGTATAGTDFTATPGSLTFPVGVTTGTITVPVTTDALDEADTETFTLTLSGADGATLADATGVGTIADDDNPPTLTLTGDSQTEGTALTFNATLSAASGRTITVNFTTAPDTATPGVDYTTTTGTLTFAPGDTQETITVPVAGDVLDELNEALFVNLSNPTNVNLGNTSATGTIVDNDPTPSVGFTSAAASVAETAGSTLVTVNLTGLSSFTVTVPYTVSGTAAGGGVDYTLTNGTFTLAPQASSANVALNITNDGLDENDETVIVTLGAPTNATPGAITAQTITITDDDGPPAVRLTSATYSQNENAGPATITATLSAPSGLTVTANYTTSNGTATAGSDYTATSGTLSFVPNVITQTFTVPITNDTTFEPAETFNVALSPPGNATLGTPNAATVTLVNDDPTPMVQFATAVFNVNEDIGDVTGITALITVTLSNSTVNTVTVNYATAAGTAGSGVDYTNTSGTLTFNPGVTTQTLTVSTLPDDTSEPGADETVILTLSGATNANLGGNNPATLGIVDNDGTPTVRFDAGTQQLNENVGPATVSVTLSNPSASAITVTVTSANGTAIAGQDYTTVNRTVTFNPNTSLAQFTVPLAGESVFENDETFTLSLSNPISATLGSSNIVQTVTILNDDLRPAVQFNPVSYSIGEVGPSVTLTATLSNPSAFTGTVNYATANGTALAGSDYAARTGTLNFPALITALTFTVPITNDAIYEGSESFGATLNGVTGPMTLGAANTAAITIAENEAPPAVQFSAAAYSVSEAGGSATITVTLNGSASAVTSTVNFVTSNGTATAPTDYNTTGGTLTFPAGTVSRTFNVSINDNGQYEGNETINLTLSAPISATLGAPNPATLTIVENDPAPVINLGAGPSVNEESGTVTLNVTLNAASAVTTTVNYATSNGTAGAGSDYTAASGTLVFPPNTTSQSINVTLRDDAIYELNETFTLNLSAPVSGTLGTSAATVTLLNTDAAPVVEFSPAALTLGEDRGPATITVTLSAVSAVTATVNYSTNNGTATAGSDFSATSDALTFAPGVTIQTISVPIINDAANEPNETFSVVTGALAHARTEAATNSTTTVTIANEDARPTCAIHKSVNVPLAIPDNSAMGVESILVIAGGSPILTDLSVRVENLQHTFIGDLRIVLMSPSGQIVPLIANFGGDKDNLIYTVFNDNGLSLQNNNPPLTGTFQPQDGSGTLGQLFGQPSVGTWKLRVADEVSGDTGTLHAWGLEVCGTVIPPTGITKIYLPIVRR